MRTVYKVLLGLGIGLAGFAGSEATGTTNVTGVRGTREPTYIETVQGFRDLVYADGTTFRVAPYTGRSSALENATIETASRVLGSKMPTSVPTGFRLVEKDSKKFTQLTLYDDRNDNGTADSGEPRMKVRIGGLLDNETATVLNAFTDNGLAGSHGETSYKLRVRPERSVYRDSDGYWVLGQKDFKVTGVSKKIEPTAIKTTTGMDALKEYLK